MLTEVGIQLSKECRPIKNIRTTVAQLDDVTVVYIDYEVVGSVVPES